MKKKVFALIAATGLAIGLTGCGNHQFIDTTYTFNEAIIAMPDGSIVRGEVESWRDYEDGDTIQVKIDSVSYLTHISNVVLMTD